MSMKNKVIYGMLIHRGSFYIRTAAHEDSCMIAVFAPEKVVRKLAKIDIEGAKEATEDGHHVTIVYVGKGLSNEQKENLINVVRKVCSNSKTLRGALGGIGRFEPSNTSENKYPVYLSLDCPGLDILRTDLYKAVKSVGIDPPSDHGWAPHCTLGYTSTKEDLPNIEVPKDTWKIKGVSVCFGPKSKHYIPFETTGLK